MSTQAPGRILALFPGALGDLLCCWPALEALRRGARSLTLVARDAWFDALPDDAVAPISIERREIADLFAATPLRDETRRLFAGHDRVESWTGSGVPELAARLAAATGAGVRVHPFRALAPGEHASAYYARCVGVAVPRVALPVRPAAACWADALWARIRCRGATLAIHAGSGSTRKNWDGMAAAARGWRARGGAVIAIIGPADHGLARDFPHDAAVIGEPLDRVAAVLARADRYLGNDSGITHLAALLGARGVALFGPTDPHAWGPIGGAIAVLHSPEPCAACGGDRFCIHRVPVDAVLAALGAPS
jgi:heptosyltransferase-3